MNLENSCSSFKYLPRGHLHEILGLRATGAFSMCVGVHDTAFELMTCQHMILNDSNGKRDNTGPSSKGHVCVAGQGRHSRNRLRTPKNDLGRFLNLVKRP